MWQHLQPYSRRGLPLSKGYNGSCTNHWQNGATHVQPPLLKKSWSHYNIIQFYRRINSVGENNTDGFTDESRPSVKQSSVNPISVANSVANKKKPFTDGNTDGYARQKKFLAGTLPTANPSVLLRVITDGVSVGIYGMACNFVATLCLIPTDISRRYGRR